MDVLPFVDEVFGFDCLCKLQVVSTLLANLSWGTHSQLSLGLGLCSLLKEAGRSKSTYILNWVGQYKMKYFFKKCSTFIIFTINSEFNVYTYTIFKRGVLDYNQEINWGPRYFSRALLGQCLMESGGPREISRLEEMYDTMHSNSPVITNACKEWQCYASSGSAMQVVAVLCQS